MEILRGPGDDGCWAERSAAHSQHVPVGGCYMFIRAKGIIKTPHARRAYLHFEECYPRPDYTFSL